MLRRRVELQVAGMKTTKSTSKSKGAVPEPRNRAAGGGCGWHSRLSHGDYVKLDLSRFELAIWEQQCTVVAVQDNL
ncbi:hypothetical protein FH972_021380 [Carpinus fangiana]|uniref:Uncharacterized protein n=1 Tax=Carpinus fangiana TaxID=176857 RepID=A0A5N6KPJ9_9ROSI|nr:hypothetical protein FH972_021380 [Carpinus fangiana]